MGKTKAQLKVLKLKQQREAFRRSVDNALASYGESLIDGDSAPPAPDNGAEGVDDDPSTLVATAGVEEDPSALVEAKGAEEELALVVAAGGEDLSVLVVVASGAAGWGSNDPSMLVAASGAEEDLSALVEAEGVEDSLALVAAAGWEDQPACLAAAGGEDALALVAAASGAAGRGGEDPSAYDVSLNDDVCDICYSGGDLLCCDNCTLAFHLQCTIPLLEEVPSGDWFCRLCVRNRLVPATREEVRQAETDWHQMETIRHKHLTAKKRKSGVPIISPNPKRQKSDKDCLTDLFVQSFFQMSEAEQRSCMEALFRDNQITNIIPHPPIASHHSSLHASHESERRSLSDPNAYRPLESNAFH
ncbi:hypothetical protein ACHAWF_006099 [Thalassiosira exigua]